MLKQTTGIAIIMAGSKTSVQLLAAKVHNGCKQAISDSLQDRVRVILRVEQLQRSCCFTEGKLDVIQWKKHTTFSFFIFFIPANF